MTRKPLIPVHDPTEEPDDPSEQAARDFWDTHQLTEEFLAKAEIRDEASMPPARPGDSGMLVRLSPETARRIRGLARKRHARLEDLVEALLAEQLTQEERRGA